MKLFNKTLANKPWNLLLINFTLDKFNKCQYRWIISYILILLDACHRPIFIIKLSPKKIHLFLIHRKISRGWCNFRNLMYLFFPHEKQKFTRKSTSAKITIKIHLSCKQNYRLQDFIVGEIKWTLNSLRQCRAICSVSYE